MERPLALHSSALSESEYTAYSSIITELIGSTHNARQGDWETAEVPVGEARGWIRGKYGVDAGLIDQILQLFPAATRQQDGTVKIPQFFAILRLISHARYGAEVDRALVFVQAPHPLGLPEDLLSSSDRQSSSQSSAGTLPQRVLAPISASRHAKSIERPAPPPPTPPLTSNPFRRSTSQASNPSPYYARSSTGGGGPLTGSAVTDDRELDGRLSPVSLPYAKGGRASSIPFTTATNPSNVSSSRTKATDSNSPTKNPFLALSRTSSHVSSLPVTVPPLPPRKPTLPLPPPPRHPAPPPVPPPLARKPSHSHTGSTSVLIRQSLMAAKTAQKASDSTLQQIKTMEVIKSSSGHAPIGTSLKERARTAALNHPDSSTSTPPLTVRSGTTPSTAPSVSSQEGKSAPPSVASHHHHAPPIPPPRPPPMRGNSRSTSPHKPSPIKPTFIVAPSDRSRDPSSSSPDSFASASVSAASTASSSRPTRSKSLHGSPTSATGGMGGAASGGRPPVPTPPPRRRPESVQVLGNSPFAGIAPPPVPPPMSSASSPGMLSRRASVQMTQSQPAHSRRPSGHSPPRSATGSATGRSTSPLQDPFSAFFSSVRQTTENMFGVGSGGGNGGLTQGGGGAGDSGLQLSMGKFARKAEKGLAPGRGYISHRLGGTAGERLVKNTKDEGSDDDEGVRKGTIRSERRSIDSNTPGMDMPSQDQDAYDWNEWERDDSSRKFGSGIAGRGGMASVLERTRSRSQPGRIGGSLGLGFGDEDEDDGFRKPQRAAEGWSRLG
ncbi:hypothetical protein FRB94_005334 [Tulasnella sp. JGI-2019a]|nr:hypothetical protein FRB94_005334 [Tulasnella sp. JGI-2019a]